MFIMLVAFNMHNLSFTLVESTSSEEDGIMDTNRVCFWMWCVTWLIVHQMSDVHFYTNNQIKA